MKKIIISGMIGNALEWYDYALYAQFATIIGQHFFSNSETRELLTYIVFAAGFIIRPIGGICFGIIGDKLGRRSALVFTIATMAIPTACIGLLPGYDTIGIFAPIILVFIRLVQGFSLGGEFGSCVTYVVEHSTADNRGVVGSTTFISMCIGMLLGIFSALYASYYFTEEELISYGWRFPFIFGLFVGFIGIYIRKNLSESPIYKLAKANGDISKNPTIDIITQYPLQLVIGVVIYISVTTPFYTATVFMGNFMKKFGYSSYEWSIVSICFLITMIIVLPIAAFISDRIGRRPVLISGILMTISVIYPVFHVIGSMDFTGAIIGQMAFAIANATYMAPVPTSFVELFPTRVRLTGIALSYNIAGSLFGGSAPALAIILTQITGDEYSISYYLISLAVLSLAILVFLYKETYRKNLLLTV